MINDHNPYAFVNKHHGPGRPAKQIVPEVRKPDSTARFEPRLCQNCGADMDEYREVITWRGMRVLVYGRVCESKKCKYKKPNIVHYGIRLGDKDGERMVQ